MRVLESWGNLFSKTLGVAAMGLLLTGCAGSAGADSIPQLVQRHEDALNADNVVEARAALCAPSTTRRVEGKTEERKYPEVVMATAKVPPPPTPTPYDPNWAAPWRTPGPRLPIGERIFGTPTPRPPGGHGILTQEEIDNDPMLQAMEARFEKWGEEGKQKAAARAAATKAAEADQATRTARATRQAQATREAQANRGEGPRPTFEIGDFESIITDQGARAEILLKSTPAVFPPAGATSSTRFMKGISGG